MKALGLILVLFALVLVAPAVADAGTVVIVKTDATVMDVANGFSDGGDIANGFSEGGDIVVVDSNDDGGGTYYCGAPGTNGLQYLLAGVYLVTCRSPGHAHYGGGWNPTIGNYFGCGLHFYPCPHYD